MTRVSHQIARQEQWRRLLLGAVALLLLFALAGLRVTTKANAGLPKSNPAHYTSAATKMEQTQPPVAPHCGQLFLASGLTPQQRQTDEILRNDPELTRPGELALTHPNLHRPPPALA